MSLINLGGIGNNALKFIRSPKTEIILAFILEMTKTFTFAFVFQFTGDQLIYTIFKYSFLMVPWIILGHGMLRHESQKTYKGYSNLDNHNSLDNINTKKTLNLSSFLLATFIIIEFLSL